MILRFMDKIDNMSFKEKSAFFEWLMLFPALSLMVWTRSDLGARLLPGAGIVSLLLMVTSAFVTQLPDQVVLFVIAVWTLLLTAQERFNRWRDFRKGKRCHSYSLGWGGSSRWLPKALVRMRFGERILEPVVFIATGIMATRFMPVTGCWIMLSGFCLACVEKQALHRQRNEQHDLVDGMIKSEVNSDTVERFSESLPQPPHQQSGAAIPSGLGEDIAPQKHRSRPPSNFRKN